MRLRLFIVLSVIALALTVSAFWLLWVQLGEIWAALGNPKHPSPDLSVAFVLTVLAGVMDMAAVIVFAWWKRGRTVRAYGSAHWATKREARAFEYKPPKRK